MNNSQTKESLPLANWRLDKLDLGANDLSDESVVKWLDFMRIFRVGVKELRLSGNHKITARVFAPLCEYFYSAFAINARIDSHSARTRRCPTCNS